jgi:hypothetical protein
LAGSLGKVEISVENQRLLGNFNNVSTYYFNGNVRIFPKQKLNGPFSVTGILLYNDREGKYLNRTRCYLLYAWHANLTGNMKFSAGFAIGGMNYSVKGTALSGDGSDIKADGSIGMSIYNPTFQTGISIGQIFNSEVQPLEEITVLHPFLNLTAEKKFLINSKLVIVPSTSIRILFENKTSLADANLSFLIRNKLFISSGIYNNNKINLCLGINNLLILGGKMNIHISYGYPILRNTLNYSFGEIGIGFIL